MKIATQIVLLVFASLFCFMTMSAKTERTGILFAGCAAGSFILLLTSLYIL